MNEQFESQVVDLKNEIYCAVYDALKKFENKTGLTPSSIDVQMIDTTPVNGRTRHFNVQSVVVGFRL